VLGVEIVVKGTKPLVESLLIIKDCIHFKLAEGPTRKFWLAPLYLLWYNICMTTPNLSVEALEVEVLIHLAYDRQELLDVMIELARDMQPIAMDDQTVDVRISNSTYEKLFDLLASFNPSIFDVEIEEYV